MGYYRIDKNPETLYMSSFLKKIVLAILAWEARAVLVKFKPKIVAVTGSVGKSSTKEAITVVLAAKYHVRKSPKSYNSAFGIPLTILGLSTAWRSPIGWGAVIMRGNAKSTVIAFGTFTH